MSDTARDDPAALDFSGGSNLEPDRSQADALDFSATADDGESAVGVLDEYVPPDVAGSELDALGEDSGDEDDGDELEPFTFTVTNPPETVSVSALIGGRTHHVELSPKVASMTESELTEEIRVIARLASQKALAGQETYLAESEFLAAGMREMGLDSGEVVREFMRNGLHLPSPQQVEAEQAEVFATRYAAEHD